MVKPGVRNIAIERSIELNRENKGTLNLLLIKQAYYSKKIRSELYNVDLQAKLKQTQTQICEWYIIQSKKIQDQSRAQEFLTAENTRLYYHEIHKSSIKRNSILKLETEAAL